VLFTRVVLCQGVEIFLGFSASYGIGDFVGLIWKGGFKFSLIQFNFLILLDCFAGFVPYRGTIQIIVV